jgi:hypothetical protein
LTWTFSKGLFYGVFEPPLLRNAQKRHKKTKNRYLPTSFSGYLADIRRFQQLFSSILRRPLLCTQQGAFGLSWVLYGRLRRSRASCLHGAVERSSEAEIHASKSTEHRHTAHTGTACLRWRFLVLCAVAAALAGSSCWLLLRTHEPSLLGKLVDEGRGHGARFWPANPKTPKPTSTARPPLFLGRRSPKADFPQKFKTWTFPKRFFWCHHWCLVFLNSPSDSRVEKRTKTPFFLKSAMGHGTTWT